MIITIDGPSGTGKTSTARILASCLNCGKLRSSGDPCGQCQCCRDTLAGKSWDVKEIDCAVFGGVDSIRDLANKAWFSPVIGKRKAYIFDESHMLTMSAWSALLRLLEEPPPHLVVILCTTEDIINSKKIPETIISRCELFPFKKLKVVDIKRKLLMIANAEDNGLDLKKIETIAKISGGNMRMAENFLEQAMTAAR